MDSHRKKIRVGHLARQCMLAAAVLSALPLLIMSLIVGPHVSGKIKALSEREADLALHEIVQVMESKLEDRQLDLLTIADYPPVAGIYRATQNNGVDPIDGSTLENWYGRLTTLFTDYARIHDGTLQIRYLDHQGLEHLRVNCDAGQIEVVPSHQLQDKSSQSYFKKAASLQPGQCYLSPINLNVDHGRIQSDMPVMRISTPLWQGDHFQGVVVINYDPKSLLQSIELNLSSGHLVLATLDGTYMHHKDPDKLWGEQIGSEGNIHKDWPTLAKALQSYRAPGKDPKPLRLQSEGQEQLLALTVIDFGEHNTPWLLGVEQKTADIMVAGQQMQQYVMWTALVVGLVAVLIALVAATLWVRPLKLLGRAADRLRHGDYAARVDLNRKDELGDLARSFNQMAEEVQRVVELEEEHARAQAANQAKSEFLANMSHEIRTPMNAILGFTDLLTDESLTAQTRNDYLQTIRRNGDHLLCVINDILDLSKVEAGKMDVEHVETSIDQLIDEVASLMRVRATEKNIQLQVEHKTPLPRRVLIDSVRLRQILLNLLGNAIKFTEQGAVRVVVSHQESDAPLHTDLRFDVIDTGIGITPQQINKLFKPFSQADNSMSRKFGGTGLGLTICKRFAEILDGDITVKSTPGEGSCFTATVRARVVDPAPAATDAAPSAQSEQAPPTPSTQAKPLQGRILLAEDGPDNQRLILFHLKKMGLETELCENGRDAADRALAERDKGTPFDVILMDMQMPVMDGYTATQELRRKGYAGPIIALTAHAMQGDRQRCLDAGCDEYETKPINKAKIHALLSALIEQQQAA